MKVGMQIFYHAPPASSQVGQSVKYAALIFGFHNLTNILTWFLLINSHHMQACTHTQTHTLYV